MRAFRLNASPSVFLIFPFFNLPVFRSSRFSIFSFSTISPTSHDLSSRKVTLNEFEVISRNQTSVQLSKDLAITLAKRKFSHTKRDVCSVGSLIFVQLNFNYFLIYFISKKRLINEPAKTFWDNLFIFSSFSEKLGNINESKQIMDHNWLKAQGLRVLIEFGHLVKLDST